MPAPDEAAAEACFREAVAAARAQGARLPELRAPTSLARLLRGEADGAAAREALASAYAWFTEGFDTLDLREARALLDANRACAADYCSRKARPKLSRTGWVT